MKTKLVNTKALPCRASIPGRRTRYMRHLPCAVKFAVFICLLWVFLLFIIGESAVAPTMLSNVLRDWDTACFNTCECDLQMTRFLRTKFDYCFCFLRALTPTIFVLTYSRGKNEQRAEQPKHEHKNAKIYSVTFAMKVQPSFHVTKSFRSQNNLPLSRGGRHNCCRNI